MSVIPIRAKPGTERFPAPPSNDHGRPARRRARARKNDHMPRERLLHRGPASLADVELVALLLGNGIAGRSTSTVAAQVMKHFGTLSALLHADCTEIQDLPGVGPARTAVLIAATELARRSLAEQVQDRPIVDSPRAVRDYLRTLIGLRCREVFVCLFLDARHRLIHCEESTAGTLTRMAVYPREITRRALEVNAAGLIVAHNHPSGAVRPSAEDRRLTRLLQEALGFVDVRLIDHIVVGASDSFSFANAGWMGLTDAAP